MRQFALACALVSLLPGPAAAAAPTRATADIYQVLKDANRKDCTTWAAAYLKKTLLNFGPHQRESEYTSLLGECLSATSTMTDAIDDGLHTGTIKRARFWMCLDRLAASPSYAMPQSEMSYLFTCANGFDPALPSTR